MRKMLIALCMAGALAGFTACGTSQDAASSVDALNGEWKITEINGTPLNVTDGTDEAFIGLDVDEKRLYGSTSCNRLLGSFEADAKKGTLRFGQAGSTRMMCPDMETERKVLDAINKIEAYEINNDGSMTLKDNSGNAVMKAVKR